MGSLVNFLSFLLIPIDPYLVIHRIVPGGAPVQVYKTETIDNNANPQWKSFTIPGIFLLAHYLTWSILIV